MISVIDGDTITVRRRFYEVRIIGIDTPETRKRGTPIECGGPQATSYMRRLALPGGRGRRVWLTTDPTQDLFDRHGRPRARARLRVAETEVGDTWRNIRDELDRMHLVTLATSEGTAAQRTELTPAQRRILKALDLPEPPRFYDFTPAAE